MRPRSLKGVHMSVFHPKTLLDKTYEIGLIIKGIDGTFEVLSGILVLLATPAIVHDVTNGIVNFFLNDDRGGLIAHYVIKEGAQLAKGHNLYVAAFLLTHGGVKLFLVVSLLLNKLWAYPWALGILGLFAVYQAYLFIVKPSIILAFLTVLDVAIIYLIYREWTLVRNRPDKETVTAA